MAKEIKDSGETREFSTGAHRDASTGKGRCDLLPVKYTAKCFDVLRNTKLKVGADTRVCLMDALVKVMQHMDKQVNNTDLIIEAIIYLCIAEGIHENCITHDIEVSFDDYAMLSYGLLQVSKHYEAGAIKYGENNWQKGMPWHVYLDCACRHTMKAIAGMEDEPHIRAAAWNLLCYLWTRDNRPELNDIEYMS